MEHFDGEIRPNLSAVGDGGGSEDRLSALPDDLLIHILLKLFDAAVAARTSVLSSRWRRLWTLLPDLIFPSDSDPRCVRPALESHQAPALRYLRANLLDASPESMAALLPIARRPFRNGRYKEGDALELPCFEHATSIHLELWYLSLVMPPLGVFAGLTDLFLSHIKLHGPCMLGDAVSSARCPVLRKLTVRHALGLRNFSIHSDSLLDINLSYLHRLQQLNVRAPALKMLYVTSCFVESSSNNNQPVANISAPQLVSLEWRDAYDPRFTQLGEMKNLQWLSTYPFIVYGQDNYAPNNYCVRLLRRFEHIRDLICSLIYRPDITNQHYLMEDITRVPNITNIDLRINPEGHSFGASVFHILRMCTGVRKLGLSLLDSIGLPKAKIECPSGCVCGQPSNWKTEELALNRLQEVEIHQLRGTEHEAALIKRLLDWATVVEKMTITFHCSVPKSKAKEFFQMLQSFAKPGICMKGPHFA